jgi:hypothetical protein
MKPEEYSKLRIQVALKGFESMVGAGRFELPTSASRTLRANQTALRPENMLYCKPQRPEHCALTRLHCSPLPVYYKVERHLGQPTVE